mmetsp:Transcript_11377/g.34474  ORF Transcript_11377/g.34474 Transcript_11377/m.34474 type:complete len:219 (+) Transcript_11377:942-1598(+)
MARNPSSFAAPSRLESSRLPSRRAKFTTTPQSSRSLRSQAKKSIILLPCTTALESSTMRRFAWRLSLALSATASPAMLYLSLLRTSTAADRGPASVTFTAAPPLRAGDASLTASELCVEDVPRWMKPRPPRTLVSPELRNVASAVAPFDDMDESTDLEDGRSKLAPSDISLMDELEVASCVRSCDRYPEVHVSGKGCDGDASERSTMEMSDSRSTRQK